MKESYPGVPVPSNNDPLILDPAYRLARRERALGRLANHPGKIVKKSRVDENIVANIYKLRKDLEELQKLGLRVVPHVFIVAPIMEGRADLYTVSEEVVGQRLEDKRFTPPEATASWKEIDRMAAAILAFNKSILAGGRTSYPGDIAKLGQFVHGRIQEIGKPKPFLVDIDPEDYLRLDWGSEESMRRFLLQGFIMPVDMIAVLEKRLGRELVRARREIREFKREIPYKNRNFDGISRYPSLRLAA